PHSPIHHTSNPTTEEESIPTETEAWEFTASA
ncbi:hypothetical protein chiPu_0021821, partial [Chiloscyllium punctatum]|nr:hypothetical protein [Chiloscyllium punctatum]